jgi:tRNA G18 (ribose-2'-O)-methylase SpoU
MRREHRFIAESELVLLRVLAAGSPVRAVLLEESRYRRLASSLDAVDGPVFVAEASVLDAIVGFALHRGVLGLVDRPPEREASAMLRTVRAEASRPHPSTPCVVVLHDVVDPDNVGSVFRHSAGFGAAAVVLSAHAGDPLYRKAVRTSMGWSLGVPYARVASSELLALLRSEGFHPIALTPRRSAQPLAHVVAATAGEPVAFVVGSEHEGLPDDIIDGADHAARIEMTSHVDSFNVATSVAIALYEWTRARAEAGARAGAELLS